MTTEFSAEEFLTLLEHPAAKRFLGKGQYAMIKLAVTILPKEDLEKSLQAATGNALGQLEMLREIVAIWERLTDYLGFLQSFLGVGKRENPPKNVQAVSVNFSDPAEGKRELEKFLESIGMEEDAIHDVVQDVMSGMGLKEKSKPAEPKGQVVPFPVKPTIH